MLVAKEPGFLHPAFILTNMAIRKGADSVSQIRGPHPFLKASLGFFS